MRNCVRRSHGDQEIGRIGLFQLTLFESFNILHVCLPRIVHLGLLRRVVYFACPKMNDVSPFMGLVQDFDGNNNRYASRIIDAAIVHFEEVSDEDISQRDSLRKIFGSSDDLMGLPLIVNENVRHDSMHSGAVFADGRDRALQNLIEMI
jgi:hypothetical protein